MMGLYDYVRCDAPLPDGKPTPPGLFQTKDFPITCMERYTITADGRLIWHRESFHSTRVGPVVDEDLNWHGDLNFYARDGGEWREFTAKFTDGQLVEIVRVPHDLAPRARRAAQTVRKPHK